ncbi:hypothetical protein SUDANB146_06406 [Streptomyces sp. enrichment culture]
MAHEGGRMRDFVHRGSDGCRLHGTAPGQGPGLILLHSGGPDRYSLPPLAHHLAACFTVLPDIRGYGRSVSWNSSMSARSCAGSTRRWSRRSTRSNARVTAATSVCGSRRRNRR